jgi:hypothetical protein
VRATGPVRVITRSLFLEPRFGHRGLPAAAASPIRPPSDSATTRRSTRSISTHTDGSCHERHCARLVAGRNAIAYESSCGVVTPRDACKPGCDAAKHRTVSRDRRWAADCRRTAQDRNRNPQGRTSELRRQPTPLREPPDQHRRPARSPPPAGQPSWRPRPHVKPTGVARKRQARPGRFGDAGLSLVSSVSSLHVVLTASALSPECDQSVHRNPSDRSDRATAGSTSRSLYQANEFQSPSASGHPT